MSLNVERTCDTAGRRRRLIAVDDAPRPSDLLAEFGIFASPQGEPTAPLREAGDRLVRRVISRRLWKHATVLAVLSVLVMALISLTAGPERNSIVRADAGPRQLVRTMAGLQLLAAGQLAFLIGWIRARSQLDFRGRYRAWKWLGTSLLTAAVVTLADLHSSLPASFAAMLEPVLGTITAARPALLILPVTGVSVALLARVLPDVGRHRTAQLLLAIAALSGFMCLVGVDAFVPQPRNAPIAAALGLIGTHLTFCSLLLHARFVAWISNDPPESRRVARTPAVTDHSRKKQRTTTAAKTADREPGTGPATLPSELQAVTAAKTADTVEECDASTEDADDAAEGPSQAAKPSRSSRRGRGKRRLRKAG